MQVAIEQIKDNLQLPAPDAALYVHLCVAGPAKASDLAEALKVHRNDVYRTAERLLARGLIETTLERPSRYAAVDPESVFATEIATRLAAVEELKHARDEISPLLTQMQVHVGAPPKSTYKVVQGRAEIYALRDRLLETAKRSVDWVTTSSPSVQLADLSGDLALLRARVADDGVKLRALVKTTEAGWKRLQAFHGVPNAEFREIDLARTVRFVIVDGSELIMWVLNDPSDSMHAKDEVAIHTTAPGFIQAEAIFFEQTWSRATPANVGER